MIKGINTNNVLITPFVASKGCNMSGLQTDDLLMIEETPATGSNPITGSIPIALEFIDYGDGLSQPTLNRNCSIALEQQELDPVIYEEGVSGSGLFYPDSEDANLNGTYKRLVWNQIKKAFYNDYQNPTQLFGMENIDISLSGTKRFYAEKIRVFTVPRMIFGEKILENSIRLTDNALDDSYVVVDDGKGNLIAMENLFSKCQAVRYFGNHFSSGSSGINCPPVNTTTTTTSTTTSTTTPTTTTTTTTSTTSTTTSTTSTTSTTTSTTTPTTTSTTTTTTSTTTPTTTTTSTTTPTTTTTTTSTTTPTTTTTTSTTSTTSTTTSTTTPTTTSTTTTTTTPTYECFCSYENSGNWDHYLCRYDSVENANYCSTITDYGTCNQQFICEAIVALEVGETTSFGQCQSFLQCGGAGIVSAISTNCGRTFSISTSYEKCGDGPYPNVDCYCVTSVQRLT